MKPFCCAALVAASLGCVPPRSAAPGTAYRRATDTHLGHVRLPTGEQAVVWTHCKVPVEGVSALEVTLGRAPSSRATVAVHDPASPKAPLASATSSTANLRLSLGAPAKGTRALTVLEGPIGPRDLERLLGALGEPASCRLSPEGGTIRLPMPCKPCIPDVECVPCPPKCPDPPCP